MGPRRVLAFSVLLLAEAAAQTNPVDVKWFDRWEYRLLGPANMGGRTTDVEGIPGNPRVIYAGTGGGGLWKTTNGGTSWTPIWEREGSFSVGDLALDPRNPDVVWLGSGEANMRNSVSFGDGVYRSTDGGKTWKHLGLKETEHIARVLVSPLDSNTAWVCAVGHQAAPNPERGVFLTTDGGVTWRKTLFLDDQHGCADMDLDPANPNVLYAAMWRFERKPWTHTSGSEQSGLFKSTDGGVTWKKLEKDLPKLIGRIGVKVAPSKPETVYIACESKEGTIYRSTNAGEDWQQMTKQREVVGRGFYYADLRVDPKDENRLYALSTNLYVSIDAGRTWRTIARRIHADHHSLWIDPQDSNRIWNGNDGGLSVSYDKGETWEAVNNIPLGQFYQIHADNRAPFYNITGGLQDNGTWTGPSRVRQPSGVTNNEWDIVSFGDGFFAWTHPDDPDLFLTESQGGSLVLQDFKSGNQIAAAPQAKRGFVDQLKYRFNWNTPIAGSPHGKSTVYVGSNVLFQSRDFGKSWEPISPDLTTNNLEKLKPAGGPVWFDNSTAENHCTIISFGESPVKAGLLWAGTDDGNLHVTSDGGKTWQNVAGNIPGIPEGSPVSHVEPSRTGATIAYVTFDRHLLDDYRPHVFKTADGGKTWTAIAGNLPEKAYLHVLKEDPKNPRILYAGTELGLYVSFTGGGQWQPLFLKNKPRVAVHDIVVHPRDNDLILGTHGRSIMILDDVGPLQQMSAEIAAKPAHLFEPRTAIRHATPMRTYGGGDGIFSAPNPPYGVTLTYWLKEKLDPKAALKLEIVDDKGAVIRELDKPAREAGLSRMSWDLRYKGAVTRRPPSEDEVRFSGGPRGPQVVPGTYVARLTVNDQKYEQKITVQLDPALKVPQQELISQRDFGLKLRGMVSEVNTTLKRMDSLKKQLTDIETLGKQQVPAKAEEWSKLTRAAVKELEAASEKLAIRPEGNRLEHAPKFAEGLSGLYMTVAGANSAPTAAQMAYFAELDPQFKTLMAEANAFLDKKPAEWSAQLQKAGAPGLVSGEPLRETN